MVFDVRDNSDEMTAIKFSENGRIEHDELPEQLKIVKCGYDVSIHIDDIPMLIKALKVAQELWGEE